MSKEEETWRDTKIKRGKEDYPELNTSVNNNRN